MSQSGEKDTDTRNGHELSSATKDFANSNSDDLTDNDGQTRFGAGVITEPLSFCSETNEIRLEKPRRNFDQSQLEPSQSSDRSSSIDLLLNHQKKTTRLLWCMPPVTRGTLGELDIHKIVHNPKLRHNINFDPELHFRPNLHGEKGRTKSRRADEFWHLMHQQLKMFLVDKAAFDAQFGDQDWCLTATLRAIRGILQTLVPKRDRPALEEIFDVDLLMQQLARGVANLRKVALWLSNLLKLHCAPVRDKMVDQMVCELSKGGEYQDIPSLVAGLRTLLGILEAMKLDVANHQIRCLRPLLIEDTIIFEQKLISRPNSTRLSDVTAAQVWYRKAKLHHGSQEDLTTSQRDTETFFGGFLELVLPAIDLKSSALPIHRAFGLDRSRISKLRADIIDAVFLASCERIRTMLKSQLSNREISASKSPASSMRETSSAKGIERIVVNITVPTTLSPETPQQLTIRQKNPPSESVHLAYSSIKPSSKATNRVDSQCSVTLRSLRSRIIDILADSSGNQLSRWQDEASSIAIEILRSEKTNFPNLESYRQAESAITHKIQKANSCEFQEGRSCVVSELSKLVHERVASFMSLSALQIFQAVYLCKKARCGGSPAQTALFDIATDIAHVGIIHWRVWGPIVYQAEM